MRNYLQPEGKLKPTHHKTITVTYNIPMPDFSGTSYKPGGKAGETTSLNLEKDGTKLWKLANDEGNGRATTTRDQMDSSYQANKLQTNLLTIMKK